MGYLVRALAVLTMLLVVAPGAALTRAKATGLIAFQGSSTRGIFVVGSDGRGLRQLTTGRDQEPVWSPDGTRIAFVRSVKVGIDRDEIVTRPAIYVVDADGSGLRRLSPRGAYDEEPSWSPDGERLAFSRSADVTDGLDTDLWVTNRDGTSARQLTFHPVLDELSDWSPDGRTIVFNRNWPEKTTIFVMSSRGNGQRPLLRSDVEGIRAAWSPDSTRVAFFQLGTDKLFVVRANGAGLRLVARNTNVFDSAPQWSPDGASILYEEDRRGVSTVTATSADGNQRRRLATEAYQPSWSPDGTEIVFNRNGLEVLTLASRRVRTIAPHGSFPTWQPMRRS
jgi:Tol biopolymer transport system component